MCRRHAAARSVVFGRRVHRGQCRIIEGRTCLKTEDLADFLSNANPNWTRSPLLDLLKGHLDTTSKEVVARLKKDWDGDVKAFDAVYEHILMMSDALSEGIIKQFPEKFSS